VNNSWRKILYKFGKVGSNFPSKLSNSEVEGTEVVCEAGYASRDPTPPYRHVP
jgi:hypothetical protein